MSLVLDRARSSRTSPGASRPRLRCEATASQRNVEDLRACASRRHLSRSGRNIALRSRPRPDVIRTIHIGPHVYTLGGTQSVIRAIRDHHIGSDCVEVFATWSGAKHRANARLVLKAARAILRAPRDTILHAHVSNGGAWLREGPLILLSRARGLRVVVTLHGFDLPEFARAHPRFVRAILRRASYIICLSEGAQATISSVVPGSQVSVLANPIGIDRESPPAEDTPPVALFAGTIGIRKGVDVLADAWRQLLDDGVEGTCRIVGDIDDFTPPALDRLTVEPAVHPNDVAALLRTARVVVLPSRAEGMPMILTESLAAGRPFVATAVGGSKDITPDPNMIVPVDDSGALASAIGRYLSDPGEAGRAGRRGQQHIADTRSPEVIDKRLREIYGSLA